MTTYYTYYSYEEFGRGYIGCRKCPDGKTPETDTYLGSYSDKTFKPTAKVILTTHDSADEALSAEIKIQRFYKVVENPHFANRAYQTSNGFRYAACGVNHHMYGKNHRESSKEKLSKSRKSLNFSGPNNHFFGKTHTEETRNKISNSLISLNLRGENNPMYGKKFSEEHREKLSKAKLGDKNPWKGKNLPQEHRKKISQSLMGENHPRYMPRDWYHPIHGTVLQKSPPELARLFPEQNLIPGSLSEVARGKQSHHKGWKV
jgi:NUMOD3 motif.